MNETELDVIDALGILFAETAKRTPEWVRITYVVLMSIIFVVGVFGNLLICFVIYRDKNMHTATNYYLFNLAASDCFLGFGILLNLKFYINFYNGQSYYSSLVEGNMICKFLIFLVGALGNNGILTLTVLAVERCVAIWHPLLLRTKSTRWRVMTTICFIWVIALLEAVPQIWTLQLVEVNNIEICIMMQSDFTRHSNVILSVLTFIIPLTIMVFVYTMIALKVNVIPKTTSRDNVFNQQENVNRSKVNKLIVALTLSFLMCWLPFFMVRISLFVYEVPLLTPWYKKNLDVVMMVTSFNSWFSVVLNPLLCNLMSTNFRKAVKKVLWSWNISTSSSTHKI